MNRKFTQAQPDRFYALRAYAIRSLGTAIKRPNRLLMIERTATSVSNLPIRDSRAPTSGRPDYVASSVRRSGQYVGKATLRPRDQRGPRPCACANGPSPLAPPGGARAPWPEAPRRQRRYEPWRRPAEEVRASRTSLRHTPRPWRDRVARGARTNGTSTCRATAKSAGPHRGDVAGGAPATDRRPPLVGNLSLAPRRSLSDVDLVNVRTNDDRDAVIFAGLIVARWRNMNLPANPFARHGGIVLENLVLKCRKVLLPPLYDRSRHRRVLVSCTVARDRSRRRAIASGANRRRPLMWRGDPKAGEELSRSRCHAPS